MDTPYRILRFSDGHARLWGYPYPHLLALHYMVVTQPASGSMINSRIEFYFSTDRIVVAGKMLHNLYDSLLDGATHKILLGLAAAQDEGKRFFVQRMECWHEDGKQATEVMEWKASPGPRGC